MGGLNRHLAQIILFLGAVAVLLPFLHLGWSTVSAGNRVATRTVAAATPSGSFDNLRVLVGD